MASVLLFDLDETLMVEEPAAVAAFEATARRADPGNRSRTTSTCRRSRASTS